MTIQEQHWFDDNNVRNLQDLHTRLSLGLGFSPSSRSPRRVCRNAVPRRKELNLFLRNVISKETGRQTFIAQLTIELQSG